MIFGKALVYKMVGWRTTRYDFLVAGCTIIHSYSVGGPFCIFVTDRATLHLWNAGVSGFFRLWNFVMAKRALDRATFDVLHMGGMGEGQVAHDELSAPLQVDVLLSVATSAICHSKFLLYFGFLLMAARALCVSWHRRIVVLVALMAI